MWPRLFPYFSPFPIEIGYELRGLCGGSFDLCTFLFLSRGVDRSEGRSTGLEFGVRCQQLKVQRRRAAGGRQPKGNRRLSERAASTPDVVLRSVLLVAPRVGARDWVRKE